MKNILAIAFALILPLAALADEHAPGWIRGNNIELSELDHAMAGAVHGHPVYAAFQESSFTAHLVLRSHETDVTLDLADGADGIYRGEMLETRLINGESLEFKTSVEFVRIERTEALERIRIHMKVNGAPAVATVTGESFSDGHFAAPTFAVEGIAPETITFQFSGRSCFGYSINLAMLVTAAYQHLRAPGL